MNLRVLSSPFSKHVHSWWFFYKITFIHNQIRPNISDKIKDIKNLSCETRKIELDNWVFFKENLWKLDANPKCFHASKNGSMHYVRVGWFKSWKFYYLNRADVSIHRAFFSFRHAAFYLAGRGNHFFASLIDSVDGSIKPGFSLGIPMATLCEHSLHGSMSHQWYPCSSMAKAWFDSHFWLIQNFPWSLWTIRHKSNGEWPWLLFLKKGFLALFLCRKKLVCF